MNPWELIWELIPQLLKAVAAIKAKGGHGSYELDLDVKDVSTGQDIIEGVEVARVSF